MSKIVRKISRRIRVLSALQKACNETSRIIDQVSINKILVVCYGNIYRSPFVAEYLRKNLAGELEIKSTGFYPKTGRPSSPEYIEMCSKYGVSLKSHRSSVIEKNLVREADMIVIMDRHNWDNLVDYDEEANEKILWLGCLLEKKRKEITDPYNLPEHQVEKILSDLKNASSRLVSLLKTR